MMKNKSIILGLCMFLLMISSVQGALTDDSKGYWAMEDLTDSSGNSLTLTNVAGATSATGILNNTYQWNSVDGDFFRTTNNFDTSKAFTISLWAFKDTDQTQGIINFADQNKVGLYWSGTGKTRFYTNGLVVIDYTGTTATSTWHHIVVTHDGSGNYEMFIGNHSVGSASGTPYNDSTDIKLGYYYDTPAHLLDGRLDEIGLWQRELTSAEIDELYNNGIGYNPFSTPIPTPTSYLDLTAIDNETSNPINIFNVTIDLNNGTSDLFFSTTNGTINTGINQSLPLLIDITFQANNHFNQDYTNYNITNDLQGVLLEYPKITLFDNETTATINEFNASMLGYYAETTNGTIYFPYQTTKTITLNSNGYDSKEVTHNFENSTELNANLLYTLARMSIKTYKNDGTTPILNFTINATSLNSSFEDSLTTTNGTLNVQYPREETLNLTVDSTGYELKSELMIPTYNQIYNFSLFSQNSISFIVKDELTGFLIEDNITIELLGAVNYKFNTTNGTYFKDNIIDGTYTVKAYGSTYDIRYYTVTVGNRNHQYLTIYLSSTTLQSLFSVVDKYSNELLEGVFFTVSKIINGSWTTISSKYSDISGVVQVDYVEDEPYKFTLSRDGYVTKTFTLEPIIYSTYTIAMTPSSESASLTGQVNINYEPSVFYEGNNSFFLIITSPTGKLTNYWVNLTYPSGNYFESGTNSIGETFAQDIQIVDPIFSDKVYLTYHYETSEGENRTIGKVHAIVLELTGDGTFQQKDGQGEDMGLFEKVSLVCLIALILAGFGYMLGGNITATAVMMIVFGIAVKIGFITIWTIIIPVFIGVILIIKGASQ